MIGKSKSRKTNYIFVLFAHMVQAIANQVQFISVRRQIEKGSYFWSLNKVDRSCIFY